MRRLPLLLLLLTGCASGARRPVQEVTAATDGQGVQHVALTTHSFYFEPNRIVVKVNTPVEVRIHNGAFFVPHNFSAKGSGAGIDVDQDVRWFGGSGTVR